jgi:PncC family amidohydrolase
MDEAEALIREADSAGVSIAAAESCTGGLLAELLTRVPGASRVFWGSFVSYTPEAKQRMLGVDEELLRRFGAVSRETALAMVRGVLTRSGAGLGVSVTGLAGPGGDGSDLPVGTVWIGYGRRGGEGEARVFHYSGTRETVRMAAVHEALRILYYLLKFDIKS